MLDWNNILISIIALLSAAISTIGLKLVERWLNKSKDKDSSQLEMRNELRTDIASKVEEIERLKAEIAAMEKEIDEWRKKYYEIVEAYLKLKYSYDGQLLGMKGSDDEHHGPDPDAGPADHPDGG